VSGRDPALLEPEVAALEVVVPEPDVTPLEVVVLEPEVAAQEVVVPEPEVAAPEVVVPLPQVVALELMEGAEMGWVEPALLVRWEVPAALESHNHLLHTRRHSVQLPICCHNVSAARRRSR